MLSPGVWQDTQAPEPPDSPDTVTAAALPYLRAYPHRLHVPTVYGECSLADGPVLLLDNAPLDRHGKLFPTLGAAWASGSPFSSGSAGGICAARAWVSTTGARRLLSSALSQLALVALVISSFSKISIRP